MVGVLWSEKEEAFPQRDCSFQSTHNSTEENYKNKEQQ